MLKAPLPIFSRDDAPQVSLGVQQALAELVAPPAARQPCSQSGPRAHFSNGAVAGEAEGCPLLCHEYSVGGGAWSRVSRFQGSFLSPPQSCLPLNGIPFLGGVGKTWAGLGGLSSRPDRMSQPTLSSLLVARNRS